MEREYRRDSTYSWGATCDVPGLFTNGSTYANSDTYKPGDRYARGDTLFYINPEITSRLHRTVLVHKAGSLDYYNGDGLKIWSLKLNPKSVAQLSKEDVFTYYLEYLEKSKQGIDRQVKASANSSNVQSASLKQPGSFNLTEDQRLIDEQLDYAVAPDLRSLAIRLKEASSHAAINGRWLSFLGLGSYTPPASWDSVGTRRYELDNHLGNVMATITDKRISTGGYYLPDVNTAQDYYAFGALMPARIFKADSNYRYGFNGKENDNDVKGTGNEQDYGMRIYDGRIGRFLSVDPLAHKFPFYTPYQFAGNTPIGAIDLDGLESQISIVKDTYFVTLQNANFSFVLRKSNEYFTEATKDFTKNQHDFTINTQMFDYKSSYDYFWARTPQPATDYTPQGYNIAEGKIISGRSAKSTFYFSRSSDKGKWSIGYGDVPLSSNFGFGGGTPIIVNGLKFGTENIYKNDAPDRVRKVGATGWIDPADWKYLDQKSNGVYPGQNDSSTGKTVLGYNSKKNTWIIVSQQNGTNGFTLDEIRDNLFKKGYDYVLGLDGSSSSTLSQDGKTKISPDKRKDSTIPAGLNITVPNK